MESKKKKKKSRSSPCLQQSLVQFGLVSDLHGLFARDKGLELRSTPPQHHRVPDRLAFITGGRGAVRLVEATEGQRSESPKVEEGFTVITPPRYGFTLLSQRGQTFVL